MTHGAQLECSCVEAREILDRAEREVRRLRQNGACEGHYLMAMQVLAALRHLDRIIEPHRVRTASAASAVNAPQPLARKRSWLTGTWRFARNGARQIDARV